MNKPVFKSIPNELITTTDGRKLFHSRSVAVVLTLAVLCGGEYYIAIEKRGNAPGVDKAGLWCLPCGYLDWNESGSEAVKREVWEEVGLNLDDYKDVIINGPTLDKPWHVKTEPDENRQNVTLYYGLVIIQKKLPIMTPNNDCEEGEIANAGWMMQKDIGNYEFAFNHDKIINEFLYKQVHA